MARVLQYSVMIIGALTALTIDNPLYTYIIGMVVCYVNVIVLPDYID